MSFLFGEYPRQPVVVLRVPGEQMLSAPTHTLYACSSSAICQPRVSLPQGFCSHQGSSARGWGGLHCLPGAASDWQELCINAPALSPLE